MPVRINDLPVEAAGLIENDDTLLGGIVALVYSFITSLVVDPPPPA